VGYHVAAEHAVFRGKIAFHVHKAGYFVGIAFRVEQRDQPSHAVSHQDHRLPVRGNTRRELRAEFLEAETPVIGMEMRLAAADLEPQLEFRVGEEQDADGVQGLAGRQTQGGQSAGRDLQRIDPQHLGRGA